MTPIIQKFYKEETLILKTPFINCYKSLNYIIELKFFTLRAAVTNSE